MTKVEKTVDGMVYLPATGTRLTIAEAVDLYNNLEVVIGELQTEREKKEEPKEE
jgi:hypothetical protein